MSRFDYYKGPKRENLCKRLHPLNDGGKGTSARSEKVKTLAEYEREAEERGVPVTRVIAEKIQ